MVRFFELSVPYKGFAVLAPVFGLIDKLLVSKCSLNNEEKLEIAATDRGFPIFRHFGGGAKSLDLLFV